MNLLCPTTKPTSLRKLQLDGGIEVYQEGWEYSNHEGIEYLNFWKCLVLNWAYKHISTLTVMSLR